MDKMPEIYDVILLGTGISECLLANFLCKDGKKVLVLDKERFSGGENGSIGSLEDLQKLFEEELPQKHGEWNVDLNPKLFLGEDRMMKLLKKLGVNIKCKPIQKIMFSSPNGVAKVPCSHHQVEGSKVISENDKINYKKLINISKQTDLSKLPKNCENAKKLLENYKLENESSQLLLRGMTLNCNEKSSEFFLDVLGRFCKVQHHHASSVFYPLYGVGEIINVLIKKFSSNRGRCMLNRPVESVKKHDGLMLVEARGLTVMSKVVVGAPCYVTSSVTSSQKVIRCLGLVDRFPVDTEGKSNSCFLTVPGINVEKVYDTYIVVTGEEHGAAPSGWFVVHASTILETANPENEIEKALGILGKIKYIYVRTEDVLTRTNGTDEKILISSTANSSMSWDSVCDDVLRLYEEISGKKIIL